MNSLIKKIVQKVSVDYKRLSIVSNPDGVLTTESVRQSLYQEYCIEVVTGTNLQLRVHFELYFKTNPSRRFLYITNNMKGILPDMRIESFCCAFNISDVFPLFADKSSLLNLPFEVLDDLYEQVAQRRISMTESKSILEAIVKNQEIKKSQTADFCIKQLQNIELDWNNPLLTISKVSEFIVNAIRSNVFLQVLPSINVINSDFQKWVDESYFATLHSNHLIHPKSVNKILPHLSEKYNHDDKVALIVIDGFTYWQYTVLESYLKEHNYDIINSTTLAWIPSITMLSRQAIFRGDIPQSDYKQNPENEKKLWQNFWQAKGFGIYESQYISDKDTFSIIDGVKRLAYVTVEMDEKMHSSTDNRDLLSLTENWCNRIYEKIRIIIDAGFTLFLTTDHGSSYSTGWRPLTQQESVYLYKDGSRGKRHLIYNDTNEQERVYDENQDISLLKHNNWLVIRDDRCFSKEGSNMITHGGSHFMEVVIPFVNIKKKK